MPGEIEPGEVGRAPAKLEPERLEQDHATSPATASNRPNLEPITADAHPPQNRRLPTQPPMTLVFDSESPSAEARGTADSGPVSSTSARSSMRSPVGPKLGSRHSPAPVRRGLFSGDRATNLIAGAAVGLLLAIFPAKKLAESYEVREVEPQLSQLQTSIEQPLAVDAGLVQGPESIAAGIHEGRKKTRLRFMLVWLLAGLPIGIGLGFVPRPGD